MPRPKRDIAGDTPFGEVLLSIAKGNKTTMSIVKGTGKAVSTIVEQLNLLEGENWIKRNKKTKEYELNYDRLEDYFVSKYDIAEADRKNLKKYMPGWIAQFATNLTTPAVSIDALGVYIKLCAKLSSIAMGSEILFDEGKKIVEQHKATLKKSKLLK